MLACDDQQKALSVGGEQGLGWGSPRTSITLLFYHQTSTKGFLQIFFHPSDCILTAATISVLCVFEDYQPAPCMSSMAASPPCIPINPASLYQLIAHRLCYYCEAPDLITAACTSDLFWLHLVRVPPSSQPRCPSHPCRLPASPLWQALLCRHLCSSLYWELHPQL